VRLGLYGGSFDPVHLGHLLVAEAAWEEAALDQVIFIPAAQSPFKPERQMSPAALRAKMLRLALAARPQFTLDLQELDRGGVSYTIDTVRSYKARFPEAQLCYIVGTDHVPLLPKWRSAAELGGLLEFLVVPRPGEPAVPFPPGFQGRYLRGFPIELSASQIRARVARGRSIDLLVGGPVAACIHDNGLYLS
jgi:nicotinate-nucleotide adenylyltransferase